MQVRHHLRNFSYFNLQTKKLCYGMAYIVDYYYCDYR